MNRRAAGGFTLLEVVVALGLVGVGVTALLLALAQGRRTSYQTRQWAEEQQRATAVLFQSLEEWRQVRTEAARRNALEQRGEDPLLGPWTWRAQAEHRLEGRPVDFYRVTLRWASAGRPLEVETRAVLRVVQ